MKRLMSLAASGAAAALLAGGAHAQTSESADAWRRLARADVEAAFALIRDNHPGAVGELGDEAFQARMRAAREAARDRIAAIDGYAGYTAVLAGFATAFGDAHISARPRLRGVPYSWAGLIMTREGGKWVVGVQDGEDQGLIGARLVSCDGQDAGTVAAARLAFRVSMPVEAQYIAHGGFIFVDDGNPFLSRPRACVFEGADGAVEIEMAWRPVEATRLSQALGAAAPAAQAGFGVRRIGDRWWIAMERLSNDAAAVVDSFEARAGEWRDSPALVVDLRGNTGGDTRHGRRLADLIYGAEHVSARLRGGAACAALWRASPGNAAHVRAFGARSQDPERARYYEGLAADLDRAVAEGRAFAEPIPECPPAEPVASATPASAYQGRVIVVTDHACFSSCLLMVRDFRALGALHVGEATNAATRYMEVREVVLPSGLTSFSTLQKVAIGGDANLGPIIPEHVFPGPMADTAKLDDWIAGLPG